MNRVRMDKTEKIHLGLVALGVLGFLSTPSFAEELNACDGFDFETILTSYEVTSVEIDHALECLSDGRIDISEEEAAQEKLVDDLEDRRSLIGILEESGCKEKLEGTDDRVPEAVLADCLANYLVQVEGRTGGSILGGTTAGDDRLLVEEIERQLAKLAVGLALREAGMMIERAPEDGGDSREATQKVKKVDGVEIEVESEPENPSNVQEAE